MLTSFTILSLILLSIMTFNRTKTMKKNERYPIVVLVLVTFLLSFSFSLSIKSRFFSFSCSIYISPLRLLSSKNSLTMPKYNVLVNDERGKRNPWRRQHIIKDKMKKEMRREGNRIDVKESFLSSRAPCVSFLFHLSVLSSRYTRSTLTMLKIIERNFFFVRTETKKVTFRRWQCSF